ncbi:MAG TPA: hypothetical protein VGN14_09020 [Candidatus Elarobacter sp.]
MIRNSALLGFAVAAAALVAACSGGGGGAVATTPNVVPPASGQRAAATITLKFTQGTHRLPHYVARRGSIRKPRFVDPAGSGLIIDSVDLTAPGPSPILMQSTFGLYPNLDGTQTINAAPIALPPSWNDFWFVGIIEQDSNNNVLSVGEWLPPQPIVPGTTVTPDPITLYMIPAGIGVWSDPSYNDATPLPAASPSPTASPQSFLIVCYPMRPFAFDANGSWSSQWTTPLGAGGIPTPQLVWQQSDNSPNGFPGSSRLYQTQDGGYLGAFDGNYDGIWAHFQTFDIDPFDGNTTRVTADGWVHVAYSGC